MKASHLDYDHEASVQRIDEILDAPSGAFEELKSIPSRDRLTFTNGFYVNCSCVFIDLADSSSLASKYKRPWLAKIYRTFISECVAVINGSDQVSEVSIHGDAVWGVFDTPLKTHINEVFSAAARLNSLRKILNCRYEKKGIDPISAGIGVDWGRALMIKAGHKGSSINEVVWMGDVVNKAAGFSKRAGRFYRDPVFVSTDFWSNLTDKNQKLLHWNASESCYSGNVINSAMDAWCEENC